MGVSKPVHVANADAFCTPYREYGGVSGSVEANHAALITHYFSSGAGSPALFIAPLGFAMA